METTASATNRAAAVALTSGTLGVLPRGLRDRRNGRTDNGSLDRLLASFGQVRRLG